MNTRPERENKPANPPVDPVFRSIAEASPDSIMLLDRQCRIQFINRTAPDLEVEDVLGMEIFEFISEEQRAPIRACFARVAETGEPGSYDAIYEGEDGTMYQWEARVGPVQRGGRVVGFAVIASDATERRAAAADRDRLFALSLDLFCVVGLDGFCKRLNPAFSRVLGHSIEELMGRPFLDLVHPDDRESTREGFAELAAGLDVIDVENRTACKSGGYRLIQWRATFDPVTELIHAVGRDITRQRALETELHQSQKMEAVGQLAGGIAHDFNNVVLSVLLNVGFLSDRLGDDDFGMAGRLEAIQAAAHHAGRLTQQLLSVSRREPVRKRPVDLHQLTLGVMPLLRRLVPATIQIDLIRDGESCRVLADPAQIEQVLLNLCFNARDAMADGGRLTLRIRRHAPAGGAGRGDPSSRVSLSVSDTGTGIDPTILERVFEPFFTTKEPGQGTGLGLATVYAIVERHGGEVELSSEPGSGTTINIFLPSADASMEADELLGAGLPATGRGETILVAEDQSFVREVVVRLLERGGYRVLAAANGEQAISMAEACLDELSLLLLDVVMPGVSGPEVYEHVRRLRPDLKVLFSSAYADGARYLDRLPPDIPILSKPYRSEELLARVREVLGDERA